MIKKSAISLISYDANRFLCDSIKRYYDYVDEIVLGIYTVIYGAQLYIAAMHQLSSIFLVSSCIYFFYINTRFN